MNNVLILSNNAVSQSESNGRIHSYFVKDFIPGNLHNFYVRGVPDIEGVNYFSVCPKKALFSKLSFGLFNARLSTPNASAIFSNSSSKKSKKVFFHLIRSFAYLNNRRIIKNISKYIIKNNIDTIYLWGCNIPFLYNYAWKLAKKNSIELIIFTGEDYPLKNYNYISFKKSLFFRAFQRRFFKETKRCYFASSHNYYANDELKSLYEEKLNLKNGEVMYFRSSLTTKTNINKEIKNLFFGGNLYGERAKSLFKIADYLEKFPNLIINFYGRVDQNFVSNLNKHKNICYRGEVSYKELVNHLYESDLLLHVEGFSDFYIKDCKYAFSTKISDYLVTGIPVFAFGPEEISGIKFLKKNIPDFVACSNEELSKLDAIINGKILYNINEDLIKVFKVE